MPNSDSVESNRDRRRFFRRLVAVAAATGLSGLLLDRLTVPVQAATNIFPADGNVGIGTTSPSNRLHVHDGSLGDVRFLTDAAQVLAGTSNHALAYVRIESNTGSTAFFGVRGADGFFQGSSGGVLRIETWGGGLGTLMAGDAGQTLSANGMVKAAVLANGNATIIRSFNNLPGGSGPTVSQPLGPGTYEVNFGVNVAQRFFSATLLSSNSTDPGGASDGQVLVSARDGNVNAVFVRTNDSTGTSTNRSFYLMVM